MTLPPPKELPPIETLLQLEAADIAEPSPVIDNLLEQGSKLMLVSSSKGHKSWTLLMLACCVARPVNTWMGLKVHKTKVLYINFEIDRFFFRQRLRAIAQAMNKPMSDFKDIDFWNLKGHSQSENKLVAEFEHALGLTHPYGLIIIDPFYKFSGGGKVENSAEDVATVMRAMDQITVNLKVAVAYAHHTPKGDVSERSVVDRGSGSGVFGRDPDAIMSISELKGGQNEFLAEFALRNHPPLPPIGLRWEFPFMRVDENVQPRKGRKTVHDSQKLIMLLPENGEPLTGTEWLQRAKQRLDIPGSSYRRLRKKLIQDGEVEAVDSDRFRRVFLVS